MLRAIVPLAIMASLAGCASEHKLATCKGPLIVLNADKWQPTAQQMTMLANACAEAR